MKRFSTFQIGLVLLAIGVLGIVLIFGYRATKPGFPARESAKKNILSKRVKKSFNPASFRAASYPGEGIEDRNSMPGGDGLGGRPTGHSSPSAVADRLKGLDVESLVEVLRSDNADRETRDAAALLVLEKCDDMDRQTAFGILRDIKDIVKGEVQQFVLKKLREFADLGGNDEIVNTFLNSVDSATEIDRIRMLSYVNPKNPLSPVSVNSLVDAYRSEPDGNLSEVILGTIARAGGDEGISWLTEQVDETQDYDEWSSLIKALGESDSRLALEYLNALLNNLIESGEEDEEGLAQIRKAILKLKKGS